MMRQFKKSFILVSTMMSLFIGITTAEANNATGATPNGKIGYSGINNGPVCNSCHTQGLAPDVLIEGPKIVAAGSRNLYKLTMTGGQNNIGGINVSADSGTLFNFDLGTEFSKGEISHIIARKVFLDNSTVTWLIDWRAPSTAGKSTLYASLLSGNSDKAVTLDRSTKLAFAVDVVDPSVTTVPVIKDAKASISAPFKAHVNTSVEFYAVTSPDTVADGNFIQEYTWSFPNSIIKKGEQVSYSFGRAQSYTVTLTTKSSNYNPSTNEPKPSITFFDIEIINPNVGKFLVPTAKISPPGIIVAGTPVIFNGAKSSPSSISQYFWDFSDDLAPPVVKPKSSNLISHTFTTPGVYTVTLAVQDLPLKGGLTNVDSLVINVVPAGGSGGGTNIATGMSLFSSNCESCHGVGGIGGSAKNIQGATVVLVDRTLANTTHQALTITPAGVDDTQLIANYLGSGAVVNSGDLIADGLSLYNNKCLICHGVNAVGVTGLGKRIPGVLQITIENTINNQNLNATPPPISLMKNIILTTSEASLVTGYLASASVVPLNGNAITGKLFFIDNCQMCHGTGLGGHEKGVSLAGEIFIATKIRDIPEMQTAKLEALKVADLKDIAAFLAGMPLLPQPTTEKGLYDMYCSYCHGLDGQGGQVAEKKLPSGIQGTDISGAYNGNIDAMTNSKLPNRNFTDAELDLMANHINLLIGNGE